LVLLQVVEEKQEKILKFTRFDMGGGVMMFNITFNNISVISWQSVLLVEETGENHQPAKSH
jgi:hypothetical protein